MRTWICAAVFLVFILVPAHTFAMGMEFDLRFAKVEENYVSEFWYEHRLYWRVAFSPSGAIPAAANSPQYQTVISPAFEDGFFLLRVQ